MNKKQQDMFSHGQLNKLINLRKKLHMNAELSGNEKNTAGIILSFIEAFKPNLVIKNIGGNGLAVIFSGKKPGKRIMLRAELDALPIRELNDFDYRSVTEGVSHKCGHDGHMAILCAVAMLLAENPVNKGQVVLLFQPAEETGQGAKKVIQDTKFRDIEPDYIFALHNFPGFSLNSVAVKHGAILCASKGMTVKLFGETAHAAHPEEGISPSRAVSCLLHNLPELVKDKSLEKDFSLLTVINATLGEKAFGTAPGFAEVCATLRADSDNALKRLTNLSLEFIKRTCNENSLKFEVSFCEEFKATVNHEESCRVIMESAKSLGIKVIEFDEPFKASEDFGEFTALYKGAFFALGAGSDHENLHGQNYDFPDKIIPTGVRIFMRILRHFIC